MSIWTEEKRKILKEFVRNGYSYEAIMKNIQFPHIVGRHCIANAIKRYTIAEDRDTGRIIKQNKKTTSKSSLRKIKPYYEEKLTIEELEIAKNSVEALPSFHSLTWNIIMKDSILPRFYQELRPWRNSEIDDEILQDKSLIQYLEERD